MWKILVFWHVMLCSEITRSWHFEELSWLLEDKSTMFLQNITNSLTLPHKVTCQKIKNPLHQCCGNRSHTQQDTAIFYVPPHNGQLDIMLKQWQEKYETKRTSPIAAFFTKYVKQYTCKSNFFPCTAFQINDPCDTVQNTAKTLIYLSPTFHHFLYDTCD
jgi:hypothetical protein